LISVAAHSGKHRLELQLNARLGRTQIQSAELHGIGNHGIDVQKSAFRRYLPRETEQIAYECFRAAGLIANLGRNAARFLGQGHVVCQKIGISENGGQRVVDFVRGAGCQLPERYQFFCLHELGLQPLKVLDRLLDVYKRQTVPAENMPALYSDHDVLIFPSLMEGLPNVLLETMASGMPVVTTETCGMPDVVEDEFNGLLIQPADAPAIEQAILRLANSEGLRKRLGEAARESMRRQTWELSLIHI